MSHHIYDWDMRSYLSAPIPIELKVITDIETFKTCVSFHSRFLFMDKFLNGTIGEHAEDLLQISRLQCQNYKLLNTWPQPNIGFFSSSNSLKTKNDEKSYKAP